MMPSKQAVVDRIFAAVMGLVLVIAACSFAHLEYVMGYNDGKHDARARARTTYEHETRVARVECAGQRELDAKECRGREENAYAACEHRLSDQRDFWDDTLQRCYEACR